MKCDTFATLFKERNGSFATPNPKTGDLWHFHKKSASSENHIRKHINSQRNYGISGEIVRFPAIGP